MAAPRVLPARPQLKKLRDSGATYSSIAEQYGVTEQAVYATLKREGLTGEKASHGEIIPWHPISREHQHCYPLLMLRTLGRRQQGLPNSEKRDAMLDSWLATIERENFIVCYHPLALGGPNNPASKIHGGFWYEKRKRADGESLTRVITRISQIPKAIRPKAA